MWVPVVAVIAVIFVIVLIFALITAFVVFVKLRVKGTNNNAANVSSAVPQRVSVYTQYS